MTGRKVCGVDAFGSVFTYVATTQGLGAQPINQPVEVVDRERTLNSAPQMAQVLAGITGGSALQANFCFRIGDSPAGAPPKPRPPVEKLFVWWRVLAWGKKKFLFFFIA